MKGFVRFIGAQGVVGLAIGFILGQAVSKVVTSLVNDIVNPVIGVILGAAGSLKDQYLAIGPVKIMWGNFAANLIDFFILAFVIYYSFRILRLDKLDKKAASLLGEEEQKDEKKQGEKSRK
ncbi:hypothetical protein A2Z33_04195 [Candidatus Gottesmanbacteria bacterium RBG_16_52_11]|uniref:Mechanosensitive ion channel protein MscL n=1 Tax=Candidatus Gottesmanbacteria bacterium RBG_16_52_11 TaxID=1798374 RepID=A0A1F5YVU2_9BACT|nr:MAG: hypothetical protein A2Z33_04195 [Candidatus Gottesmanbacteria bacterium RBG_16_52_11]